MSYFADAIRRKFSRVVRKYDDMHGYQREKAVKFLLDHPFCALFIDLGLGKTIISLTAIVQLVMRGEASHVLVIAPIRVANETWPTEIGLWEHTAPLSYKHIRSEGVVDAINAAAQRARAKLKQEGVAMNSEAAKTEIEAARLKASQIAVRADFKRNPAVIHIINREQVEFLVEAWGRDWPYDTVVIDESDSLKDHRTKRFKALRRVRPLMKRMYQLTATPASETYLHLFAQIFLLDEGKRLGRTITSYQDEYFNYNIYTMRHTLRKGAEERIAEKISDICLVMKAEDYLPPMTKVMITDTVILSPDEMALYRQMETDFVVQLNSGAVVEAETAAARSQKLVQMASGVVYETILSVDEYGELSKSRIVHHLHEHKIAKLQQIVEDSHGETILVAYTLKSSLERLKKAYPHAVVMDSEGKCVKDWSAGKIRMLLVSPQSAGHGLNLQYGGRRIVFFDVPWSLGLYKQTIGRLARQGQKLVVMVHHIVAQDTIDSEVVACLQDKDASQETLFRLLKGYQRKLVRSAANALKVLESVAIQPEVDYHTGEL